MAFLALCALATFLVGSWIFITRPDRATARFVEETVNRLGQAFSQSEDAAQFEGYLQLATMRTSLNVLGFIMGTSQLAQAVIVAWAIGEKVGEPLLGYATLAVMLGSGIVAYFQKRRVQAQVRLALQGKTTFVMPIQTWARFFVYIPAIYALYVFLVILRG